jgi:hypothetical protein
LFAPLEREAGCFDPDTLSEIVGFVAGGPLSFCTIGAKERFHVTYVSWELAVRPEQVPSAFGRYELLTTCDDEPWVRTVITKVARMSLEAAFDHHNTLDIGAWVDGGAPVQGIVFVKANSLQIDGASYGVLRCIGVLRPELAVAQSSSAAAAIAQLKNRGAYPKILTRARLQRAEGGVDPAQQWNEPDEGR